MIADFNTLQQSVKGISKTSFRKIKVAVLGNYATQFLAKSLSYAGIHQQLDLEVYNADYDQVESEILNPASALYAFRPAYIIITLSSLKLQSRYYSLPEAQRAVFLRDYLEMMSGLLQILSERIPASILINNLEILPDPVFESLFAKTEQSFTRQLYEMNQGLMVLAAQLPALYVIDLNGLIQYHGARHIRDWRMYINADLYFSLDFYAVFAARLTAFIAAFAGSVKKCLVLDLDNTLWGGVVADDGLSGIEIGELGIGKAFTALQQWCKQLKERGIILAVCSKNQPETARAPFDEHPEMVLRYDDIAVFMANWHNKADNIRAIQQILNIGFDAMVFVDDNPAERELVRSQLPQVCVPELPDDPALYLDYLQGLHLFETAAVSAADKDRTRQYREEASRQQLLVSLTNMEDYLRSLEMQMDIGPFREADIPRIAQLTQRSNQFNLRTIRYTDHDIAQMANNDQYITYAVKLRDKFGDYGLIALLILKKENPSALFIDTWIMSCRVLKRGVENAMLNHCAAAAIAGNYHLLVGEYLPTPKNGLVQSHYEDLQFNPAGSHWHLHLNAYTALPHYISLINN